MKKSYSLDYSIERDIDRLKAVEDILDKLEKKPSPTDLEQMGSYILYGKDENGLNAYQRGEMIKQTRYNTYRTKDDENLSLDAILENPMADQQELKPLGSRDPYVKRLTTIRRPRYDKKTGALLDIGDGDIPGMEELWHCIDKLEHWIAVLEGRIAPAEGDLLFDNPYRLYRLKHTLIDLRRHQYYLKDSYKPAIHFLMVDHPKRQYIDWNSDSFYWITREEWERRINSTYFPISKKIEDYETRAEGTEVKWMVRKHTFNWEDPKHIYALICNYAALKNLLWDKLDTVGHTLLLDFERYSKMANLPPNRAFILRKKLEQANSLEICDAVLKEYGIKYGESRMTTIVVHEIPKAIARAAAKHRLLITTPREGCKKCNRCAKWLPKNTLFYGVNNDRRDNWSSRCKDCEREVRIEKGEQHNYDQRRKDTPLFKVQTEQTGK